MSSEISLVFLGGIADSGKSALIDVLQEGRPGVKGVRVSDYFRKPLEAPENEPLSAGVIYRDWKSEAEHKAVEALTADIKLFRGSGLETLIINTHFATFSPGGYMMGLDPPSLQEICKACLLDGPTRKLKAGVILIDIGIGDVLQRREEQWKTKEQWSKHEDVFPTGPGLAQDLEFNRLYALQYYSTLGMILSPSRVFYYRAIVDYKQIKDLRSDLKNTLAFQRTKDQLVEFLRSVGIVDK